MEKISSNSNQKVLQIKKLLSSKSFREQEGKFVAEGANIVKDIPNDRILQLYFTEETFCKYENIAKKSNNITLVTDKVMSAISDTKTPSGVLAVCSIKAPMVKSCGNSIVLDNLQDPGNAGTILRTAVACGISDIYCYGDCVDLFSPKVVRSSMGGIFYVNVKKITTKNQLDAKLYVLDMNGENLFEMKKNQEKFALLVGNESNGVSQVMKNQADKIISLPMSKNMESLNAGVSLSIALYHLLNGGN